MLRFFGLGLLQNSTMLFLHREFQVRNPCRFSVVCLGTKSLTILVTVKNFKKAQAQLWPGDFWSRKTFTGLEPKTWGHWSWDLSSKATAAWFYYNNMKLNIYLFFLQSCLAHSRKELQPRFFWEKEMVL